MVEPERTVALGEAPRARTRPRASEDTSLPMFRASAMDRPTASGSGSALSSARLALNHSVTINSSWVTGIHNHDVLHHPTVLMLKDVAKV